MQRDLKLGKCHVGRGMLTGLSSRRTCQTVVASVGVTLTEGQRDGSKEQLEVRLAELQFPHRVVMISAVKKRFAF